MVDILIGGLDSRLLETRKWLMEAEGYCAHTAVGLAQLERFDVPIRLLILCHTVPIPDAKQALQIASSRWPDAPRIVLIGVGAEPEGLPGVVLHALKGPEGLVATVKYLLDG